MSITSHAVEYVESFSLLRGFHESCICYTNVPNIIIHPLYILYTRFFFPLILGKICVPPILSNIVRSRIGLHNTIFLQGYGPYLISIFIAGEKQNAQEAGATSPVELLEDISSSADGTSRIGLHNTQYYIPARLRSLFICFQFISQVK